MRLPKLPIKSTAATWDESVLLTVARCPGLTAAELGDRVREHAIRGARAIADDMAARMAPGAAADLRKLADYSIEVQLHDHALQLRRALGRLLDEGRIRSERRGRRDARNRPRFEATYYIADTSIEARPFPTGRTE